MKSELRLVYEKGILEGARRQRKNTASRVFSYIIDHGELIPEEACLSLLADFLKDKQYNKVDIRD